MKRNTLTAAVVISVLLSSALLVMPVSATPTAQASGGFQSGQGAGKLWQSLEKMVLRKIIQSDVPDNMLRLLHTLEGLLRPGQFG